MVRCKTSLVIILISYCLTALLMDAQAGQKEAYAHMNFVMDQFNKSFDVYTDNGSAGNHFVVRCMMNEAEVLIDEAWTQNCHSGATCIKNAFLPNNVMDAGLYYNNGVLLANDVVPSCNWGDSSNAGLNLVGATSISFWARGETGGEEIEFYVGGMGRDPFTGKPITDHPDSFPRVPAIGTITTLTTKWQKYTIDLTGSNLSYVIGGFAWYVYRYRNQNGAIFYIDDIAYNKARANDLRLLVSYQALPYPPNPQCLFDFDTQLKNVAFTYDNVIALLTYLARGNTDDVRRATILADALIYAQNHDRYFEDWRLRNAYQGGDLILWPGWTPNNKIDTARLPGWWNICEEKWIEEAEHVGTDTGNMAWVMIGLLRAYKIIGKSEYLVAAEKLGDWIELNTKSLTDYGGYTGGYEGFEPNQNKLTFKSTEHNIDLYVAFMTLFDIAGDSKWYNRGMHAKNFVRSMWRACNDEYRFSAGIKEGGADVDCNLYEDANTWGLMALGETSLYGAGIDWVQTNCRVSERCYKGKIANGIDFNDDKDGIWWEGTAHLVIAKRIKKENAEADYFLKNIYQAQWFAPSSNGMGIAASCRDEVTTGIDFILYNRLHVAATSWFVLAERKHNPFWGITTFDPIPHEGE